MRYSILLPTAGGPHAEYAAEIASAIARPQGATINVVNVIAPNADETEREDAREKLASTTAILESDDTVESTLASCPLCILNNNNFSKQLSNIDDILPALSTDEGPNKGQNA